MDQMPWDRLKVFSVHQILEYLRRAVWGPYQMGMGAERPLPCLGRRVS